ncbi:MAG: choice-of-anchor D domain-containing protein [bacterium]|nr:choice-of-anchor D domain-containing protein [bacterium]
MKKSLLIIFCAVLLSGCFNSEQGSSEPEIEIKQGHNEIASNGMPFYFGSVAEKSSSPPATITIANAGSGDLQITDVILSDPSNFTLEKPGTNSIAPGKSTTMKVTFSPASAGIFIAAITIYNNDSDEGIYVLNIKGTGTSLAQPEIAVEVKDAGYNSGGSAYSFGTITTGYSSPVVQFSIENKGEGDLSISGIVLSDTTNYRLGNTAAASIAAGSSTSFSLTFAPSSTGTFNAAVTISSNDSDEGTFILNITGTGTNTAAPEIALTSGGSEYSSGGTAYSFDPVVTGQTGPAVEFAIENQGSAALSVSTIVLSDTSNFTLKNATAGSIAAGKKSLFRVQFNPAATGTFTASITISNSDADEGSYILNITGHGSSQDESRDWVIMYYVDADNDLEGLLLNDVNEIEGVNFDRDKVTVIALIDRVNGHWSGDGNWTDSRAFEIGYDSNGYNNTLCDASKRIAIPSLGITESSTSVEVNMGDGKTLEKFISFCRENYPAKNYMMLFTNHGGGWRSGSKAIKEPVPVNKAICRDESNGNDSLYMPEIKDSMARSMGGNKAAIVAMDACLMSMVEVAYELRDVASILLSSSETIPGYGYPYTQIMNRVKESSGSISPESFYKYIIDEYYTAYTTGTNVEGPGLTDSNITLTAADLSKIGPVASAIDRLGSALNGQYSNKASWMSCDKFSYHLGYYYLDIYDFCNKETGGYAAERAAVQTAIDAAVLHHIKGTAHANSHGLAVYFPPSKEFVSSSYSSANIDFAGAAPNWVNFINNN